MNEISEKLLAEAFESVLDRKHGIADFPKFHYVFKEVISQQGIPDFVALNFKNNEVINRSIFRLKIKSINSCALIYSLLKSGKPTTEELLIKKTGLSKFTLRKALNELCESLLVNRTNDASYVINKELQVPNIDIWAFELKISNWKRALFQAMQYKAFANYAYVVFPPNKEKLLRTNINQFISMEVGVMTFDSKNSQYKLLYKPKKKEPISKIYKLSLLGQLLTDFQLRIASTLSGQH